jgi:hypothetical protein
MEFLFFDSVCAVETKREKKLIRKNNFEEIEFKMILKTLRI